jgi:hypothetical protein
MIVNLSGKMVRTFALSHLRTCARRIPAWSLGIVAAWALAAAAAPARCQSFPPAFVNCTLTKTNGTFTTSGQPSVTATFIGTWIYGSWVSGDTAPPMVTSDYGAGDLGWSLVSPYDGSPVCQGVAPAAPDTSTGEQQVDLDHQIVMGDPLANSYTLDMGHLTLHSFVQDNQSSNGSTWASMPPSGGATLPTTPLYWCFKLTGTAGKTVTCHVAQAYIYNQTFTLYSGQTATISTANILLGTVTHTLSGPSTTHYGSSSWVVGSDLVYSVVLDGSGTGYVYVPFYCGNSIQLSGTTTGPPTPACNSTYEVRLYSAVVS